jgi:hypothetical protein
MGRIILIECSPVLELLSGHNRFDTTQQPPWNRLCKFDDVPDGAAL